MKLITETIESIEVLTEEKANGKKDYKIRGVFMQADIKNRNGRVYPVETLAKEVARYTKEFINKNGEFTVNVALVENGIPILGVVSAPAINETFIGFANEAYKVINKEHRKITSRKQSTDHCLVTVSKSHKSEKDQLFIDLCHKEFGSIEELPTGSSLKLCRVAEGRADIYSRLGPTYQWDIAAGQAVAVAAGGVVSDLSGRPLRYEFKSSTKNPQFFCAGDNSFSWKDVFLKLV